MRRLLSILVLSLGIAVALTVLLPPQSQAAPNCKVPNPPPACNEGEDPPPSRNHLPIGYLDTLSAVQDGIRVQGWAIDRDVAQAIDVHIYLDGSFAKAVTAGLSRPDVAAAFPNYGDNHGFDTVVAASKGLHTVCVYGINLAEGDANPRLGCNSFTMPGPPSAATDIQFYSEHSTISVSWYDRADDEAGYLVERSEAEDGSWTTVKQVAAIEAVKNRPQQHQRAAIIDSQLQPDTRYCYRVSAENNYGKKSIVACTMTALLPTSAPTELIISPGKDSAELTWIDNATDEDNFAVLVDTSKQKNGAIFRQIEVGLHQGTGSVSYTVTGLFPKTAYCFRIVAQKAGHSDADSSSSCATTTS